jgi:hypothetical protein
MASGIEVAGLALALLPLFVETAKVYSKGMKSIQNVAMNSRRDEKLLDFYDDFWWETDRLHRQVKNLVNCLPNLCPACKSAFESDKTLTLWGQDEAVRESLLEYFGSQEQLDAFTLVMTRILGLFDRLLKDRVTHLSASEKVTLNYIVKGYERTELMTE